MTINEVGEYTLELLKEYLPSNYHEWEVEFFGSKEIAGRCFCYRRIIQFSTYAVKYGTGFQIQDLVKHEVAHAIAFTIDNNCFDHGELWKYICYYIGCSDSLDVCIDENYDPDDISNTRINVSIPISSVMFENVEDDDFPLLPW